jgi:hypothetical protein
MKISYIPMSQSYNAPGDRRRFYGFAKINKIKLYPFNYKDSYDCIVLSQMADISYFCKYKKSKIIFDFCDSYFHEQINFRKLFRGVGKFFLGKNKYLNLSYNNLLKNMCLASDAVICTTKEQKNIIRNFCNNTYVILDFFDSEILGLKKKYNYKNKLRFFWEGYPGNIYSFKPIANLITKLINNEEAELHLVTDSRYRIMNGVNFYLNTRDVVKRIFNQEKGIFLHDWSLENLNKIGSYCDIGLIPSEKIDKGIFAHKPSNKLHLLWKLGLPTLTSPTFAMTRSILESDVNLLCNNLDDWEYKINFFKNNPNKIKKISKNLKNFVRTYHSDKSENIKWLKVFKDLNIKI